MEILWVCLFVLATGACIGSFLNVVALRALSKESIIFPSSKCPKCQTPIKWYDNIPVFSYLFTFKGKCRSCGEKVSLQYPIVEAITSIIFLAAVIAFGFTVKTLLLLILFCITLVIIITDIKKEYVFERHAWLLIMVCIGTSIYLNGIENYQKPLIGLIAGVVIMEFIAKISYYLVRKKEEAKEENQEALPEQNQEQNQTEQKEINEERNEEEQKSANIDDENFDINEYIKKNKRAFGEGDTYLAAASGALLGWKYFLIAMFLSIIFQAVCLLPQFLTSLYREKHFRLLTSLSAFLAIAIIYWILVNIIQINIYVTFAIIIALLFFAIDTINSLKKVVNKQGFSAIPFGPSILIATLVVLIFGKNIAQFLVNHIFI